MAAAISHPELAWRFSPEQKASRLQTVERLAPTQSAPSHGGVELLRRAASIPLWRPEGSEGAEAAEAFCHILELQLSGTDLEKNRNHLQIQENP